MPSFVSKCGEDIETIFVEYLDEIAANAQFKLYTWGRNSNGDLGDGTSVNKSTPIQIGVCSWKWASVGYRTALAIKADGTGMSWGNNGAGRLGDNTVVTKSSPVAICGTGKWKMLSGGGNFGTGIKTDGTLWAWGCNFRGQLGDGTTVNKSTPVQMGTGTDWRCVVASPGGYFTTALKTNGTVWTWGSGARGSLGDGTTICKSSPVQVGAATTWKCISLRGYGVYGWKTDGTIWHWGNVILPASCTNVCYSTPVQFATAADNWKIFSNTNSQHVLAVKKNGTLWAWGSNHSGQLGDGTTVDKCSPIQIGSSCDWRSTAGEFAISFAIKTDGTLWAWGTGDSGALGDATTVNKSTPIQVGFAKDWYCVSNKHLQTIGLRIFGDCSCT